MRSWLVTILLIGGCGTEGSFIGDDVGAQADETDSEGPTTNTTDEPAADTAPLGGGPQLIPVETTCEALDTSAPRALELTPSDGEILVVHGPSEDLACAEWTYDVTWSDHVVEITYLDESTTTCAETCGWTFTYRLTGLEPGTWSVIAETDAATAEVP